MGTRSRTHGRAVPQRDRCPADRTPSGPPGRIAVASNAKKHPSGVFLHLNRRPPGIMSRRKRFLTRVRIDAMPEQLSDAILLERFVSFREEAAFVALVERYGPLVQRVCRRVLHNEHDVEDVFQATFLVLARRAGGIAWSESVGGWLGARSPIGWRSARGPTYRGSTGERRRSPRWPRARSRLRPERAGRRAAGTASPARGSVRRDRTKGARAPGKRRAAAACRRSIARRSFCATSRAGRTRKPHASLVIRPARCRGGSSAPERSCGGG